MVKTVALSIAISLLLAGSVAAAPVRVTDFAPEDRGGGAVFARSLSNSDLASLESNGSGGFTSVMGVSAVGQTGTHPSAGFFGWSDLSWRGLGVFRAESLDHTLSHVFGNRTDHGKFVGMIPYYGRKTLEVAGVFGDVAPDAGLFSERTSGLTTSVISKFVARELGVVLPTPKDEAAEVVFDNLRSFTTRVATKDDQNVLVNPIPAGWVIFATAFGAATLRRRISRSPNTA